MQSKLELDIKVPPRLCEICKAMLLDDEGTICRSCREIRSAEADGKMGISQHVQHNLEGKVPGAVEAYRLHCESCPQCSALSRKAVISGQPSQVEVGG